MTVKEIKNLIVFKINKTGIDIEVTYKFMSMQDNRTLGEILNNYGNIREIDVDMIFYYFKKEETQNNINLELKQE